MQEELGDPLGHLGHLVAPGGGGGGGGQTLGRDVCLLQGQTGI